MYLGNQVEPIIFQLSRKWRRYIGQNSIKLILLSQSKGNIGSDLLLKEISFDKGMIRPRYPNRLFIIGYNFMTKWFVLGKGECQISPPELRPSPNIKHVISWSDDVVMMLNLIESSSVGMLELGVALGNSHFTYLLATRSTSYSYDRGSISAVFIFANCWDISLAIIIIPINY